MSKRLVGAVDEYDGDRFFTRLGGKGKTVATPLLLCLVCIELSDFVFAVDSIPAVLGISQASGCCFESFPLSLATSYQRGCIMYIKYI